MYGPPLTSIAPALIGVVEGGDVERRRVVADAEHVGTRPPRVLDGEAVRVGHAGGRLVDALLQEREPVEADLPVAREVAVLGAFSSSITSKSKLS